MCDGGPVGRGSNSGGGGGGSSSNSNRKNFGYDGQVTQLEDNQRMLQQFSAQCVGLLVPLGEAHVTHKTKEPFDWWGIPDQMLLGGLSCRGTVVFDRAMYPPYVNRKVRGRRATARGFYFSAPR